MLKKQVTTSLSLLLSSFLPLVLPLISILFSSLSPSFCLFLSKLFVYYISFPFPISPSSLLYRYQVTHQLVPVQIIKQCLVRVSPVLFPHSNLTKGKEGKTRTPSRNSKGTKQSVPPNPLAAMKNIRFEFTIYVQIHVHIKKYLFNEYLHLSFCE